MPRDKRLYMTFTNDFWQHPKIEPLSDAAFRTFVEMNGYSRMQDLDGRIPCSLADKKWRKRAISELLANHGERPSIIREGDDYVIWNYEEHQFTRADRDALVAKNAANGAKGGRPPKNPTGTEQKPSGFSNGTQTKAESESGSKSGSEGGDVKGVSQEPNHPSSALTDEDSIAGLCAQQALAVYGVEFAPVRSAVAKATDTVPNPSGVLRIIVEIMGRSKGRIDKPTGYVINSIRNDWAEWQQFIHEEGLVA